MIIGIDVLSCRLVLKIGLNNVHYLLTMIFHLDLIYFIN